MPRPTIAQLAYGSLTVVLSTFAMLLLSDVRSGAGVAAITVAGLILGLIVAVTVSLPAAARSRSAQAPSPAVPAQRPHPRVTSGATQSRVGEHSLRR